MYQVLFIFTDHVGEIQDGFVREMWEGIVKTAGWGEGAIVRAVVVTIVRVDREGVMRGDEG